MVGCSIDLSNSNKVCSQNGGTGVSPVKSGVTPDFVEDRSRLGGMNAIW
jgi:hypothetical protein